MKRTFAILNNSRDECLAVAIALSLMIWLLRVFSGGTSVASTTAPSTNHAKPMTLGVWTESPDAPNSTARAAETTKEMKPQLKSPPSRDSKQEPSSDVADADLQRNSAKPESTVEKGLEADMEMSETANTTVPNKEPSPDQDAQNTQRQESKSTVSGQGKKRPNEKSESEELPKPIDAMSDQEVQDAINAYRAWVHRGEVTIKLDLSRLSPSQLNSIAAAFLLTNEQETLWIDPAGNRRTLSVKNASVGEDWIADLPLDRAKWPPQVTYRANESFGKFYPLESATILLSKRFSLTMFRSLSESLDGKKPKRGAVFVLRLIPRKNNHIEIKVIH